jgi:hypothetical protein
MTEKVMLRLAAGFNSKSRFYLAVLLAYFWLVVYNLQRRLICEPESQDQVAIL